MSEKYPDGCVYLLPLGKFDEGECRLNFDSLVEYAEIFLGLKVVTLPSVELKKCGGTTKK